MSLESNYSSSTHNPSFIHSNVANASPTAPNQTRNLYFVQPLSLIMEDKHILHWLTVCLLCARTWSSSTKQPLYNNDNIIASMLSPLPLHIKLCACTLLIVKGERNECFYIKNLYKNHVYTLTWFEKLVSINVNVEKYIVIVNKYIVSLTV